MTVKNVFYETENTVLQKKNKNTNTHNNIATYS